MNGFLEEWINRTLIPVNQMTRRFISDFPIGPGKLLAVGYNY
jgi:hypothetical protein